MNSQAVSNQQGQDLGLAKHQIGAITKVLAVFPTVRAAAIYGSRASGRHTPGSDIDLVLFGDIDLETRNTIYLALDNLMLPWDIDLTIYGEVENPQLRMHIDRAGREIYRQFSAARG